MIKDLERKDRPNRYLKCKKCPDHIDCNRYTEAELYRAGIPITRHVWNEEEKAYYRKLQKERNEGSL